MQAFAGSNNWTKEISSDVNHTLECRIFLLSFQNSNSAQYELYSDSYFKSHNTITPFKIKISQVEISDLFNSFKAQSKGEIRTCLLTVRLGTQCKIFGVIDTNSKLIWNT